MSDLKPIRISTLRNDIGYTDAISGVRIFVDGGEHHDAITVDERKGYIIALKRNKNGGVQAIGESIATKIIRGNVRIKGLDQDFRESHTERMSHRVLMVDSDDTGEVADEQTGAQANALRVG